MQYVQLGNCTSQLYLGEAPATTFSGTSLPWIPRKMCLGLTQLRKKLKTYPCHHDVSLVTAFSAAALELQAFNMQP